MAITAERPLETGWLADTPVGDTLLRRFAHNQADVNAAFAAARSGRVERRNGTFLADADSPVAYLNQAILTAPVLRPDDPVLDEIDEFFVGRDRPATVLSIWPTPDLADRGWSLVGHPAFVVRAPGPATHERPAGIDIALATTEDDFAIAERVVADGYPIDEARDAPPGSVIPSGVRRGGVEVRLAGLSGDPVGVGVVSVGHGITNLCLAVTLPTARRRGVWEALVWERITSAPDLPAVAFTSDMSRPGFERIGFVPVTRLTLWLRADSGGA